MDEREDLEIRTDSLVYKVEGSLYTALEQLQRDVRNNATDSARDLAGIVSDLAYARESMLRPRGDLNVTR